MPICGCGMVQMLQQRLNAFRNRNKPPGPSFRHHDFSTPLPTGGAFRFSTSSPPETPNAANLTVTPIPIKDTPTITFTPEDNQIIAILAMERSDTWGSTDPDARHVGSSLGNQTLKEELDGDLSAQRLPWEDDEGPFEDAPERLEHFDPDWSPTSVKKFFNGNIGCEYWDVVTLQVPSLDNNTHHDAAIPKEPKIKKAHHQLALDDNPFVVLFDDENSSEPRESQNKTQKKEVHMSEEPEPHKEDFSMLNMARQTFGMDSVFSSPSSETFSPRLAYELPGIIVTEDEDPGLVFHVGISKDKIVAGMGGRRVRRVMRMRRRRLR